MWRYNGQKLNIQIIIQRNLHSSISEICIIIFSKHITVVTLHAVMFSEIKITLKIHYYHLNVYLYLKVNHPNYMTFMKICFVLFSSYLSVLLAQRCQCETTKASRDKISEDDTDEL